MWRVVEKLVCAYDMSRRPSRRRYMSYGSVEERQIDVGLIFDAKTDIDRLGSNIYF